MTMEINRRNLLQLAAAPLLVAAAPARQDYLLLVYSDPLPGREAEYDEFYNNEHMPDVTSIPGFVSAQRFKLCAVQLRNGAPPPAGHVVISNITTDYLPGVWAEVNYRLKAGITRVKPVMDGKHMGSHSFEALGGTIHHDGAVMSGDWRQQFVQLVYSDPVRGMAAAYNQWYDHTHLPQVMGAPDFVAARRYRKAVPQLVEPGPATEYLALFQISSASFPDTVRQFQAKAPHMSVSKAFDGKSGGGYSFQAIGPAVVGDELRARAGL